MSTAIERGRPGRPDDGLSRLREDLRVHPRAVAKGARVDRHDVDEVVVDVEAPAHGDLGIAVSVEIAEGPEAETEGRRIPEDPPDAAVRAQGENGQPVPDRLAKPVTVQVAEPGEVLATSERHELVRHVLVRVEVQDPEASASSRLDEELAIPVAIQVAELLDRET